MTKEFKLPELGENIENATVSKILIAEGDKVEKGENVIELETDKAVTELPCDIAGTIASIHVQEGDEIEVGQTLFTLEEDGDEGKSKKEGKQDKKSALQQKEQKTESKGESSEPKETSSNQEKEDSKPDRKGKQASEEKEGRRGKEESVPAIAAAPSVRRLAREIGVEIESVEGSGPNGRVTGEDVKARARSQSGKQGRSTSPAIDLELPDFSRWGDVERENMSKIRRLTAEQMRRASTAVPQAVQFGSADLTSVNQFLDNYKKMAAESGGHLSLTVILLKTVAGALKKFPRFNASIDYENNEIIYKKYCHIGVAMATERGLTVPVIRDVDQKNILELAVELKDIIQKAREGKLQVEDMQGGNITITNAGALGGGSFVPIVNWPEAAILGVAQSKTEAVYQNGSFEPRTMLPLSLVYDHRLNDGADSVQFLQWIIDTLENPLKIALEG